MGTKIHSSENFIEVWEWERLAGQLDLDNMMAAKAIRFTGYFVLMK